MVVNQIVQVEILQDYLVLMLDFQYNDLVTLDLEP